MCCVAEHQGEKHDDGKGGTRARDDYVELVEVEGSDHGVSRACVGAGRRDQISWLFTVWRVGDLLVSKAGLSQTWVLLDEESSEPDDLEWWLPMVILFFFWCVYIYIYYTMAVAALSRVLRCFACLA
jgi:hypothetical protein